MTHIDGYRDTPAIFQHVPTTSCPTDLHVRYDFLSSIFNEESTLQIDFLVNSVIFSSNLA
jgi:hypothetical protein